MIKVGRFWCVGIIPFEKGDSPISLGGVRWLKLSGLYSEREKGRVS